MKKIGLISDTHGFVNEKLFVFFAGVDEIWHAGDIGNIETADRFSRFREFRAVHGNIDGNDVRVVYGKNLRFMCEETDVWITHITGYPGNYDREVLKELLVNPPGLLISGHSHILKVIYDRKFNFLYLNPGAAGMSGFHRVCTALRFTIDGKDFREMEVWEFPRRNLVL